MAMHIHAIPYGNQSIDLDLDIDVDVGWRPHLEISRQHGNCFPVPSHFQKSSKLVSGALHVHLQVVKVLFCTVT